MKKIIPILLVAITTIMLSSCIIIAEEPKYRVYFNNDTPSYVYDWYLKNMDDDNFAASDSYCEIPAYSYDYVSKIPEDKYQFWFCLLSTRTTNYYVYTANYYHVDRDMTFYLSSQTPYSGSPRSAVEPESLENTDNLVLKDSEGNEYPLEVLVIEK